MRGSNPHAEALVPKTSVSANSTNLPYICRQDFDYYFNSLLEVFFILSTLAYEYTVLVVPQGVEPCVHPYKERPQTVEDKDYISEVYPFLLSLTL